MYKIKIVLLLCAAATLAACGSSGSSNRPNAANNVTPTNTEGTTLSYMDYIKKMVASSSDDTEPVDVEMVKVEQSDDTEAVEVL